MGTNLDRTAKALAVYDSEKAGLTAKMAAAMTNDAVWDVVAEIRASENRVREAFALDTADVNPRDRAMLVHPDDPWLRRQVAKYGTAG